MNIKKFFSRALVSLALLSLFACHNEKSIPKGETPILKVHFIGSPQKDGELVEAEINKYLLSNYGFEADIVFTDFGDFNQKMQVMINTGEQYDIVFTCSWTNQFSTNVEKGAFLDIKPYLSQEKFAPLKDTIDPGFWAGATIDNGIYAVPTQKEIAAMSMWQFNMDVVNEANFDYKNIKSSKDFEPLLSYAKENRSDLVPLLQWSDRFYNGSYDYPFGTPSVFAVQIEGENRGKVVFKYDLKDIKENVDTMRNYFLKGYINQDAATKKGNFTKGDPFAISLADGQPYANILWSSNTGLPLETVLQHAPVVTTTSTRGSMMAINRNSKNPEVAMEFLQLINTDSYLHNLLNYGIEGTHYTKVGENTIKRTKEGEDNYYVPSFGLGNLFNTYLLEGEPEDKWEEFQRANDLAKRSPLLGLEIDKTQFTNELAAITNLQAQYEPLINTGSVDPDILIKEYKDKLDKIGYEKIRLNVQSQIDEYLSKE